MHYTAFYYKQYININNSGGVRSGAFLYVVGAFYGDSRKIK
jgi:hypothetical protein